MGDYANDAIEREWNEMLDEMEDGDIDDVSFIHKGVTYTTFEFKSIKTETEKAWCLIMMGGAEHWLPKSRCSINKNMVAVPDWLHKQIMKDNLAKKGFR